MTLYQQEMLRKLSQLGCTGQYNDEKSLLVIASAGLTYVVRTRKVRGGLLVDDEMVLILRVALVAVGGVGSHELAAFRAGSLTALTFLEVSRL